MEHITGKYGYVEPINREVEWRSNVLKRFPWYCNMR